MLLSVTLTLAVTPASACRGGICQAPLARLRLATLCDWLRVTPVPTGERQGCWLRSCCLPKEIQEETRQIDLGLRRDTVYARNSFVFGEGQFYPFL